MDEPLDVEKLLELCAKATPPPWQYDSTGYSSGFVRGGDDFGYVVQTWSKHEEDFVDAKANGEFIAAARTALPAALARVKELEAQIVELMGILAVIDSCPKCHYRFSYRGPRQGCDMCKSVLDAARATNSESADRAKGE